VKVLSGHSVSRAELESFRLQWHNEALADLTRDAVAKKEAEHNVGVELKRAERAAAFDDRVQRAHAASIAATELDILQRQADLDAQRVALAELKTAK